MRSELFRIPIDLGPVPLFGFGVLLALWVIAFAALLWRHVKSTNEDERDLWGYLVPVAIGAAAILFLPRLFPDGVPIRGYGVMLLTAVSTGLAMAVHRARRHGVSADTMISLAVWLFVGGIAGARLFFVIEYWEERFGGRPLLETLIEVVRFTEGGLVVYGSLIGGTIAFVAFARRHGLPVVATADLLAPCFTAGLAIGRLGCLLNGCCYGGPCDAPWAVTFPTESPPFVDQLVSGQLHGVRIEPTTAGLVLTESPEPASLGARVTAIDGQAVDDEADVATALGAAYGAGRGVTIRTESGAEVITTAATRTRSLPVHPTQIYSAINAGLLAWLLWSWRPRRNGEVVLLLATLYPISRFLLEVIRTEESPIFGTGLSISQNVSIGLLAATLVGWVVLIWWGSPVGSETWGPDQGDRENEGTVGPRPS